MVYSAYGWSCFTYYYTEILGNGVDHVMKPILAITMGDPAGIGSEVVVKALSNPEISKICIPVVIGDYDVLADANKFCKANLTLFEITDVKEAQDQQGVLNFINMGFLTGKNWSYKKVSPLCGKASFKYVQKGIELAMSGKVHGVVTGPINKNALNQAGYNYNGHTEIFADFTKTKDYGMILMSGDLRVIHVTTHVAICDVSDLITQKRVYTVIKLAHDAVKAFGLTNARIAVAGFNPHAGEDGLFGNEEETAIIPAINQAKKEGINVEGPFPPDTVFIKAMAGLYDVVVAMYHDQGHIPLKMHGFKIDASTGAFTSVSGINCTVGLPIIRVSVDHGTAFDIAGEGRANEDSMIDAIKAGVMLAKAKFKPED